MDREISPMREEGETEDRGNCALGDDMTAGLPLAMVYSPKQEWRNLYTPAEGLKNGTLFVELNLPFLGSDTGDTEE